MRRILFSVMAVLCLLGSTAAAQTVKQKVAVYVTGEVETGYKKVIGSKLVTGITRSDDYAAVERTADFLAEMAKEQDYQMSGAVSDNQIARLGQQFGVRYVLVADISEVFESIFVSVRMIDVQTAQITGATEASSVVNSMEGLTELADTVIANLLGGIAYGAYRTKNNIEDIKIIGPFSKAELHTYYQKIPEGYHVASEEEVRELIRSYKKSNKSVVFPIYAGLIVSNSPSSYVSPNCQITATLFRSEEETVTFNNHRYYYNCKDTDIYRRGWRETGKLIPGYVYLIKNK